MGTMLFDQGNGDFECYVSVSDLLKKIKNEKDNMYKCRTIGYVTTECGHHQLHEINEDKTRIRVSMIYVSRAPPTSPQPYAVQLYGSVRWKNGLGPVMYPRSMQAIPAWLAIRLRDTMKWVIDTHNASLPEPPKKRRRKQ